MTRTFPAKPAVREGVPLLIGIMSPSGGGKTYSALRLATGMQQVYGGDIFGIDTENNRMLHYADMFKFQHVPFTAPFGSLDYLECLRQCSRAGARVMIIDSMTHEHIGEGGYLETADATIDRILGDKKDNWQERQRVQMLGWANAGPKRQRMIEGIKQLPGAFIFCFRAKEKAKPIKVGNKTEVVDMGFMPIAGEEWVYEMACNIMLQPRSDGVPTWRSDQVGERLMMKLPIQFKDIFAEPRPLDEAIGVKLASWAQGAIAPPATPPAPIASPQPEKVAGSSKPKPVWYDQLHQLDDNTKVSSDTIDIADRALAMAAERGMADLELCWHKLPKKFQSTMKAALERRHKPTAREVDGK